MLIATLNIVYKIPNNILDWFNNMVGQSVSNLFLLDKGMTVNNERKFITFFINSLSSYLDFAKINPQLYHNINYLTIFPQNYPYLHNLV